MTSLMSFFMLQTVSLLILSIRFRCGSQDQSLLEFVITSVTRL